METMIERKYALIRIEAGDYLLPSNDGKVLWRISTYRDGTSYGLVLDRPRDFTAWGYWKFDSYFDGSLDPEAIDDWSRWEMWEGNCSTRQEAIDRALQTET